MAVYYAIGIAVLGDEALQLHRCLWQILDMEGHVLDEARCANRPHGAHRREDARADGPKLAVLPLVVQEVDGHQNLIAFDDSLNQGNILSQLVLRLGLCLEQHGRCRFG